MTDKELQAVQERLNLRIALNNTVTPQTREEQDRLRAETAGVRMILNALPAAAKHGDNYKDYLHGCMSGMIINIRIARGDAGKFDRILASLCDQLVGAHDALNLVKDHLFQLRFHPEKFKTLS